jgi:hypothetical protein
MSSRWDPVLSVPQLLTPTHSGEQEEQVPTDALQLMSLQKRLEAHGGGDLEIGFDSARPCSLRVHRLILKLASPVLSAELNSVDRFQVSEARYAACGMHACMQATFL